MVRIITFIAILFFFFIQLPIVVVPLFLWYLFRYGGFELVIGAILLDGYYGGFLDVPALTIVVFVIYTARYFFKRHFLSYTTGSL